MDTLQSSISSYADKKVVVILRDGRKLVGYLRSYDQYYTVERIYAGNQYADLPRGIFLVRGENLVFIGECVSQIDDGKSDDVQLILQLQRHEIERREKIELARQRVLTEYGYGKEMEMELY